ncbi:hypothetical protein EUX98_g7324 [Antrodiella citrinella]|uniref:HAT C-terminal dimerisation domain-containing protein n=1 Tax=Antrodiella citrinella TaxID=2447956 RepID=A0A4S4MP76_9APHY|nr:hypothetical protein EUX98_g7324 [Antrodiella citrinella]
MSIIQIPVLLLLTTTPRSSPHTRANIPLIIIPLISTLKARLSSTLKAPLSSIMAPLAIHSSSSNIHTLTAILERSTFLPKLLHFLSTEDTYPPAPAQNPVPTGAEATSAKRKRIEPAYPTLYRIALDVLPAQASAVPCERIFSSSKATDAVRRGRLSPKLMESLQILKFLYRSQRGEPLDFSKGLQSLPSDLEPKVTAQTMTSYAGEGRLDQLDSLIIESEADQLPPDPIDSYFVLPTVADGDDDW